MIRPVIVVLSLTLVGCVVPTPPAVKLEESPSADLEPLNPGEAIAVLDADESESLLIARCVQEELSEALTQNRVMTAGEARDLLFPWLEPEVLPKGDAATRALIARPTVAAKLRELRLRYLIEVGLERTHTGGVVGEAPLAAGAGTISDRVSAVLVDLEAGCRRPGGVATATGVVGGFVVGLGIVFLPVIEGPACHRLSAALVEQLTPAKARAP